MHTRWNNVGVGFQSTSRKATGDAGCEILGSYVFRLRKYFDDAVPYFVHSHFAIAVMCHQDASNF